LLINIYGTLLLSGCNFSGYEKNEIPPGQGIAWLYPGDEGIEDHPGVVFSRKILKTENLWISGPDGAT
jgi:hypothetical protein